jgi:hypothetical protein
MAGLLVFVREFHTFENEVPVNIVAGGSDSKDDFLRLAHMV